MSALNITRFSQLKFSYKILTLLFEDDRTEYLSIRGKDKITLKDFKQLVI